MIQQPHIPLVRIQSKQNQGSLVWLIIFALGFEVRVLYVAQAGSWIHNPLVLGFKYLDYG